MSVEEDEAQADGKKSKPAKDVNDNEGQRAHHGRVGERDRPVPCATYLWFMIKVSFTVCRLLGGT